jgi:hypothetical protein
MMKRCYNLNDKRYPDYGGRGITVCKRWRNSFKIFLADMGLCPKGKTIDRIDNNGNYKPGNCRWATADQQANNRRNNIILNIGAGIDGTLSQWCQTFDLDVNTVWYRVKKGYAPYAALFTKTAMPPTIEIGPFIGTLREWSDALNINYSTLRNRINRGYAPYNALFEPHKEKYKRRFPMLARLDPRSD